MPGAEPWSRRYDEAEPQRVNRWLAQSGVCSRREAEALIAAGRVTIDGETVADAGRKILPGQTLTLVQAGDGGPALGAQLSVVMHKPVGVVSAQPEPGQVPAARLLTRQALWGEAASEIPAADRSLAPLGRLDQDSRGLLLLSEDGVLAKALIGPASKLDKEYRIKVGGEVTEAKLARLRHGLELDGRALRPAKVRRVGAETLAITLIEGRNRQIRRMCDLVELTVIDLMRIRIGPLRIGELPQGRWRPLSEEEREALIRASSA